MENYKIEGVLVSFSIITDENFSIDEKVIPTDIRLPDDSPARMKVLKAEGKKWYLTIVYHEDTNQPFALFCHTNHPEKGAQTSDAIGRLTELAESKGIYQEHITDVLDKCKNENNVTKLTRVISLLLRHGVLIKNIVKCLDQMEDIFVGSFLFQLKKFLSQYIKDGEIVDDSSCTQCQGVLIYSEGCMVCSSCGASKCQ